MEDKKYTVITAITDINELTIRQAEQTFFAYKDRAVIIGGVFADDKWLVCDEYAKYTFDFNVDEEAFKGLGGFIGVNSAKFKDMLKTYVISMMGVLVFTTIRNFLADIKKIISTPLEDIADITNKVAIMDMGRIIEFISIIPSDRDKLEILLDKLDYVDERISVSSFGNKRTLASFDSYFKFNDIIDKFWAECHDESLKLFYFPIWLWWHLSAILPMRPREFVLTPRSCLSEVDCKFYLTIRKSKLKGSGKTKSYRIAEDYFTVKYEIPKKLANEIKWYLDKTIDELDNELHTLFTLSVHYEKWERSKSYRNRYFTYINLTTCLRYFFNEVVCGLYGYKLVFDNDESYQLKDNEINYLHLGDTRHLALINLIAEGATPMVAMMLAGHDNPEMSSHYYSNITTLIECRTYRQYKKLIKGKQNYVLSKASGTLKVGEFLRLGNGGRCYSERVRNDDFSDCYKVCGPAGEIGYCKNCTYYRDEGKAFNDSKDLYRNRIAYECANLAEIVAKVRKQQGESEEIVQALLRIKDTEYSYQQYLLETKGK